MERSPRAEALHLVQLDEEIAPPKSRREPLSSGAMGFLESIEPWHFASMARTIDNLFEEVFSTLSDRPPDGLIEFKDDVIELEGWQHLAASVLTTFTDAEVKIRQTQDYKNSEGFKSLIGRLNPYRHIDLQIQLISGVTTANNAIFTTLRNAPHIIRECEPDASLEDVATILRHPYSLGLLRPLAKRSVNQLLATESALSERSGKESWNNIDSILKPKQYKLNHHTDGTVSLGYTDLKRLKVRSGYTTGFPVKPVHEATYVENIRSSKPVIGCPITLLQGRLAQLFDWSIDLVEHRNLWNEDWPPKAD